MTISLGTVSDGMRVARLLAVCLCAALAACGGHSPTGPSTPVSIACPNVSPVTSLDGTPQVVSFAAPAVTGGQAPITTKCSPASGSSFPVGQDTVTCTAADAKAQAATCTFVVDVQPPPILDVTSLLAFGDSITWGEDGTDAAAVQGRHLQVQLVGQTYPEDLEKELQARYLQQLPTVTNCGERGEYLSDPATVQRYLSQASTGRYGSLLIMEGSNDVDEEDTVVLGQAITNLQAIVDDAKSRGMHPFVATIPPMVPPGADGRAKGAGVVPTYNDMVRALAGSEGVPLVDIDAAFGTNAPALIGFDGLHPNAGGYQLIADTFFAAIKSVLESQSTMSIPHGRHVSATGGECSGLS